MVDHSSIAKRWDKVTIRHAILRWYLVRFRHYCKLFFVQSMYSNPRLAVNMVEHRFFHSNICGFTFPPCGFRLDGHKSAPLWRNIANHISMWARAESHRLQAAHSRGVWLFVPELFCLHDDESCPTNRPQWSSSVIPSGIRSHSMLVGNCFILSPCRLPRRYQKQICRNPQSSSK